VCGGKVRRVMVRRKKKKKRKERKGEEKAANKVLDWSYGTGTGT